MKILSKAFNFVLATTKYYNIDESHGLSHSMNVLNFAHILYKSEIINNPNLSIYQNTIYSSAILHDMCDKKYMNETEGFEYIKNNFNNDYNLQELNDIKKIISCMSYSTVKKKGFPKNLDKLYLPYHIVREADLLSAYDFDRCMIYNIYSNNYNIYEAYNYSVNLFENRMFKHNEDNLFVTEYGKYLSLQLEKESIKRINQWKEILESDTNSYINNIN